MDGNKKIIITGLIVLTVVIFGLVVWWQVDFGRKAPATPVENIAVEQPKMSSVSAHELALARAKEWRADAQLSYQKSLTQADAIGGADDWLLIFVSASTPGKGFEITIKNQKVTETQETPYVGEGSDAALDLITPAEAIKKAEEVRGKKIEVLGVEAIFNQDANEWFWGIKTPSSTISIRASRAK